MRTKNKVYAAVICSALYQPTFCHADALPSTVLVVANSNNSQSVALADYYMKARKIPISNQLLLDWNADDNAYKATITEFKNLILQPILNKIATLSHIDYIVLCRNLPTQVAGTSLSADSMIAGYAGAGKMDYKTLTRARVNPYYNSKKPFNSTTYGVYLVNRLDGWSWDDAFALVDHSMAATKGDPFLFDRAPQIAKGGYEYYDETIGVAGNMLIASKVKVIMDNTSACVIPSFPLGGLYSWGSHEPCFRKENFAKLKFAPGAIAETIYSFSGMSLRFPGVIGGSQSAILIHAGVTGIKGYVTEPYAGAIANPEILFPNYLAGRNLAEAFYSASAYMVWKDIVLGDPLCSPYSTRKTTNQKTTLDKTK